MAGAEVVSKTGKEAVELPKLVSRKEPITWDNFEDVEVKSPSELKEVVKEIYDEFEWISGGLMKRLYEGAKKLQVKRYWAKVNGRVSLVLDFGDEKYGWVPIEDGAFYVPDNYNFDCGESGLALSIYGGIIYGAVAGYYIWSPDDKAMAPVRIERKQEEVIKELR